MYAAEHQPRGVRGLVGDSRSADPRTIDPLDEFSNWSASVAPVLMIRVTPELVSRRARPLVRGRQARALFREGTAEGDTLAVDAAVLRQIWNDFAMRAEMEQQGGLSIEARLAAIGGYRGGWTGIMTATA